VQHASCVAQDYLDGTFSGMNNLVEVIGGAKPRTIEDSVGANRSLFETRGVFGITEAHLPAAQKPRPRSLRRAGVSTTA
jgi:hypothetical protein